ncbi:MAG: hypothetical protein GX856_03270 [Gammaproteobacteria bacterium]|jgi:hypothetical protein|nr:hypothetical protein [Gammaproteobacteria bacterium]
MSATRSTDRHGLPTTVEFDRVFVPVFWRYAEAGFADIINVAEDIDGWNHDSFDPDKVRAQLRDCIDATLDALGVEAPEGDDLDWLGYLYDMITASSPALAEYLDATTEQ